MLTVLVVDDEESMRKFFELTLKREGYRVISAGSVAEAKSLIRGSDYDLVLSDIKLGDGNGLEVLMASKARDVEVPVIMMTAYASPETAVDAMKQGAADYLTKPFNVDEVRVVVKNHLRTRVLLGENRKLREQLEPQQKTPYIFHSKKMRDIFEMLQRVAKLDATILVTGESGTGKEVVMKTIHGMSLRSGGAFISVNCGALPESLLESELFGYEKGAFTGADQRRQGLFESAKGGTLFLDEIGEMPLKMQIKLLRVLQERKIRRVGGTEELPIDIRLLVATNRNLEKEVKSGNFREDLFYRINVVPIELPPLRERADDIAPLVRSFLDRFARQYGETVKKVTNESMKSLETYAWPGNVRELENTVERIVALTPGELIELKHLPFAIAPTLEKTAQPRVDIPAEGLDLEGLLDEIRFQYMKQSLDMTGGIQTKSCELLKMSFRSFRYYYGKGKELGYFVD